MSSYKIFLETIDAFDGRPAVKVVCEASCLALSEVAGMFVQQFSQAAPVFQIGIDEAAGFQQMM